MVGTAEGNGEGWADPAKLEALGVEDVHASEGNQAAQEAETLLGEYPLEIKTITTFEAVLGVGGPDERLVFECSGGDQGDGRGTCFEINRVLYRFSWASESVERVLSGDDREVAEAFAERVVPELVE